MSLKYGMNTLTPHNELRPIIKMLLLMMTMIMTTTMIMLRRGGGGGSGDGNDDTVMCGRMFCGHLQLKLCPQINDVRYFYDINLHMLGSKTLADGLFNHAVHISDK